MGAIVLKVLSIVLIVILVLVAIVLALLAIVLFWPVKYRGNGYFKEKEHFLGFKASWLAGLVRFTFTFTEQTHMTCKILWFDLLAKKQDDECMNDTQDSGDVCLEDTLPDGEATNTADHMAYMTDETKVERIESFEDTTETEKGCGVSDTDAVPKKQKFSFRQLCDKIVNIKENVSYYIAVLTSDATKETIHECKDILFKVFRKILPKKLHATALFGFGEPDVTGQVYGAYCMFSDVLGKNVIVTPDFEKKIFCGEFSCKGKIRGITLLVAAIKLYFHKGLRKLITEVKKGGKINGR